MTEDHLEPSNDYLWDRSGRDPELGRLEQVLSRVREHCPIPELGSLPDVSRGVWTTRTMAMGLAVAATVLIALAVPVLRVWLTPWTFTPTQGTTLLDGRPIMAAAQVGAGQILETDAQGRGHLVVGVIGHLEIAPGSRVRFVATNRREHRLALDRGRISAVIDAPPRWFVVETPVAAAIDLGCAYTMDVDAEGNGELRVDEGWVQLEDGEDEALVPAGAAARMRRGHPPGSPFYRDSSQAFQEALTAVDFGSSALAAPALAILFREARPRDSLTLLSLLRRVRPESPGALYDRLAALLPPPGDVTRGAIVAGDRNAVDRWWAALQLSRPRKLYPKLWLPAVTESPGFLEKPKSRLPI
ncbi:MAG TPA: hypothetical protein VEA16_07770 [Vicinamibacterales bacterium]|nr:hypothetical protein [Vicinamibacterales bacterium]